MILEKISQVVDIAPSVLEQLKKSIVNERNNIPIDVPDPFFKGPF
jgi:hypothetical protein